MTILPPLEAGASSLLQVEDIRSEAGEDLVIHHGQTWVQDILGNIRVSDTYISYQGQSSHIKKHFCIVRYVSRTWLRSFLTSRCFVVTGYSGLAGSSLPPWLPISRRVSQMTPASFFLTLESRSSLHFTQVSSAKMSRYPQLRSRWVHVWPDCLVSLHFPPRLKYILHTLHLHPL